jgi:hypothetical protein
MSSLAGARESEFVGGESGGIGFDFLRPLAAGGFIQHVARRCMVVDSYSLPEAAAQQSGGRHAEGFSGEVP